MSSVNRFPLASLCLVLSLVFSLHLQAQVTATAPTQISNLADYNNRWDAYGSFGYARFQTSIGHALKTNMYGWKGQATRWFSPVVGITANTGNYYGTITLYPNANNLTNASISEHLFLFGPEVRLLRDPKWTVDAHLLIGGTYGIFDTSLKSVNTQPTFLYLYNNQLAFAMALGGSYDYNFRPNWSVRMTTDFQPTHYGYAFQKEFAGSLGIVYKWGAIQK